MALYQIYLFDLDGTLIDEKIYDRIYEPVLKMICAKRMISIENLDKRAEEVGLKKNKKGRWDTGDLCFEFGLLDQYYEILLRQIEVGGVLKDNVVTTFSRLKDEGKVIGVVSNSMRRTIKTYIQKYVHIKNLLFF